LAWRFHNANAAHSSVIEEYNMAAIPPKESLIEYPSDFPIKVMGPTHDAFTVTIIEVITKHDPTFHEGKVEIRPSSGGKYTGLTVTVRATSREQLDARYAELSGHPMVKVVL
jgi:putative lipoic acid-binding regulatory protein